MAVADVQTASLRAVAFCRGKRVADRLVGASVPTGPTAVTVGLLENRRAERSVSRSIGQRRKPLDQLFLGDRPAEQQQLPGDLRGAACRALGRHDEAGAILRARPVELVLEDVLAGLLQFRHDDRHQLGNVALPGRRVHAENAGVGKAPMERVDRVAEAAFLAHLLEQPRRHAAAEDHRQHLRGVEVAHVIGAALEAEDDLRVHQVAVLAEIAADIMRVLRRNARRRGCGSRRTWPRPRARNRRA